jgi:hypothetical protein
VFSEEKEETKSISSSDIDILHEKSYSSGHGKRELVLLTEVVMPYETKLIIAHFGSNLRCNFCFYLFVLQ